LISVMTWMKNDRDRRDFRRIGGNVQLFERNVDGEISVEPIPGLILRNGGKHGSSEFSRLKQRFVELDQNRYATSP